ncbi:hypothetical protein Q5752_001699 [Cryptotrichosporon argae]
MAPSLPPELILALAQRLAAAQLGGTLAALALTSASVYDLVAPALYAELIVGARAESLAALVERWRKEQRASQQAPRQATHVRAITIHSLPSDAATERLFTALVPALVPRVHRVALGPSVARDMKQWEARHYPLLLHGGSAMHPLHMALTRLAPRRLTVDVGANGPWAFAVLAWINDLCAQLPLDDVTFAVVDDFPMCPAGARTAWVIKQAGDRTGALVNAQLRRDGAHAAAAIKVVGVDIAQVDREEKLGKQVWRNGVEQEVIDKLVFRRA